MGSRHQPRGTVRGMALLVTAAFVVAGTVVVGNTQQASGSTGSGGKVQVVYSSYNDASTTYRLSQQSPKTLAPVSDAQASLPTIALDPSVTYQPWEGFGGSLEDTSIYNLQQLTSANRAAALDALYNPSTGDAFSLTRLTIGCADFCRDAPNYWTYDDNGGVADPTLANFSIQRDVDNGLISTLQQIRTINPATQFFASLWSPPAWMKTNNSIIGTQTGTCPTDGTAPSVKHGASTGSPVDYYPALANYYVKYIQAYAAQGIPIYAVTLQNEPNIDMNYPSTCFTPAQQADFAVQLKSAFSTAGISAKIWGLDDNEQNTFPYSDAVLGSTAANAAVDGLGFHNYAGTQLWEPSSVHAAYPTKTMHLTEITNGADRLVEYFRNWVASYSYWVTMYQFMPGPGPGYWSNSTGSNSDFYTPSVVSFATGGTTNYQLNAWYYTFGQFSRYIQPGAVRIDSTDRLSGNLTNVAFRNPDGTIVTVVVNRIPTSLNSGVQNTPAAQFRIVTPDGQLTDTIPGDTVATYVYTPTTGDAVSTSGAVVTSSVLKAGYSAAQAVDGNTATTWTSGANQASGQSFTIDLGASKTFDQISLNLGSLSGDSPSAYSVSTSTDGSTWGTAIATGSGTASMTNITFSSVSTRYLRISLTAAASRWWSIGEVSLYNSSQGLVPLVGGNASASATYGTDVASNAIDGTEATRWSSGVAQANGQTFTVDLGVSRSVNALELDSGANAGDYPRGYSLSTSTNGSTWLAAVATGKGTGPSTWIEFPTTTARYLRVTQTGSAPSNFWSISEARAYNATISNLPRSGWAATASISSSTASNALDGSGSTRWTTGAAQAAGQWFQVDLGSIKQTAGIDLDATTSTGDYPRGFTVTTSDDGTNWVTVASGAGLTADVRSRWDTAEARYVRVTLTTAAASAFWSIGEVNVRAASPVVPTAAPLSRSGWTASASNSASGQPASNAIDGSLVSRWSDGLAQSGTEWFQADMGSAKTFSRVQLNAAGGLDNANGDYPRGYEVYVSNGSGWTLVAAGSGTSNVLNITFPPQTARYINVHETGSSSDHFWSISEFNVYA